MANPTFVTNLGELDGPIRARLDRLREEDVLRRIWDRDHTVWRPDPTEIADRLGWLDAVDRARDELPAIRDLVTEARADGLIRTVLLGMGGSSLAPEVIRNTFHAGSKPAFDLTVLDTTHPDAIARLEKDLDRTLFVVSSKSGTTIETRAHLAYFLERVGDPKRFVAITDPGSPLEDEARTRGFRGVFQAPADVGGRYSALTPFGLVPAALTGVDPELLLVEAARAFEQCLPDVPLHQNPAAVLGAAMGEAALAGRDKLTLAGAGPLGAWIEQLVAESTGKDGTGILPVDGEPAESGSAKVGTDRLFVAHGDAASPPEPCVRLPFARPADLGGLFFVWELATAIAGHVLGIHPFDQPDVQAAKDRTQEVLDAGDLPEEPPGDLSSLLAEARPGDYVAIQAFADPTAKTHGTLQRARGRIAARTGCATTLGFGPRYLHSTGQLHKGGPNTGVFLQILEPPREDRAIPGRPFTFGRLIAAQAAGDLDALRERGRRAARIPLRSFGA